MQLNSLELEDQFDQVNKFLVKGKNSKAVRILNKFIEHNPLNDNVWLLLGIAKRRLGRIEEAIDCFKTASEINPKKEEIWGLYTITLIDNGQLSEAQNIIKKAGDLNPENEKLQFYRENLIRVYEKFGPFF